MKNFLSLPILVVAGLLLIVLGLAMFRGLFGFGPLFKTQLGLSDTALRVQEIKEIGELISAEYIGEFIHSLNEINQEPGQDSVAFKGFYEEVSVELRSAYSTLVADGSNNPEDWTRVYNDLRGRARSNANGLKDNGFWILLTRGFSTSRLTPTHAQQLSLIKDFEWAEYYRLDANQTGLRRLMQEWKRAQLANYDLYYLCRGWVKAAYDLSAIDPDSVEVVQDSILQIKNIDPVINVIDINPWFITPQKGFKDGVPGYHLIKGEVDNRARTKLFADFTNENAASVNRSSNNKEIPYKLVQRAKSNAKAELLKLALESRILQIAHSSAEASLEALIGFFPDSPIKAVELIPSETYQRDVENILSKDEISYMDLLRLNPSIVQVPYYSFGN